MGQRRSYYVEKIKISTNSASHKYHGSVGDYYCFGNKSFYGKVATSSVSQYALKNNNSETKEWGKGTEKQFSLEIRYGIQNLSKHIPNIKQLISPVLDVAYKMQKQYGDVNMKEVELSEIGI